MKRIRVGQQQYNAAYYAANRERIRRQQAAYAVANREKLRAARKGLTHGQFQHLMGSQDGRCAICRAELTAPQIDHDHACCPGTDSCGACVRGLLCAACNLMLGKAYDRPEVLAAGAEYLRQFTRKDR